MTNAVLSPLEQRIGRKLTAAEHHVAVEQIDQLLNHAKDDLEAAIRSEQARLARQLAVHGNGALQVTVRMRQILRRLQQSGRNHGQRELHSMGYQIRRHAAGDTPGPGSAGDFDDTLQARLRKLTVKINEDALGGDITTVAVTAIERAVIKVLGARSIAADLVSPVFISGLAQTFEQHADAVEAWQYTGVLDQGQCDPCASQEGEIFATLAALFAVLPAFGPNPDCLGGDRCRCRAVPVPPAA
jgi:hypothetical protein